MPWYPRVMRTLVEATAVACGIAVLAMATAVQAGPAEGCQRMKNLAAGRYARCRQQAAAKVALTGDTGRYQTTIAKCRTTYSAKWSRAEDQAVAAGGACIVVGDDLTIRPLVDGNTTRIADALTGAGLSTCSSALASCESDLATCLAGCTEGGQPLQTEQQCHLICTPGEDSQTMAGLPRSYRDNGNGTIGDLKTGLTWEKLSNDGTIHDADATYDWTGAIATKIAALNTPPCFATHCDWRLPNATEALSIASYDSTTSGVAAAFDQGCVDGCDVAECSCTAPFSWTSTSRFIDFTNAWFFWADVGGLGFDAKTALHAVRAVRGGL
jgi:hypothetical protein